MINGFARKPDKSVEVPTDPQINCTNLIFDLTKKKCLLNWNELIGK